MSRAAVGPRGWANRLRVTYVGHATLLLDFGGVRVLTDPNFDRWLARILPRVSPPGVLPEQLPRLDAMLLTHAHADHLSFASLDALPQDVPLYAPPAVTRWLRRRGYAHAEAIAPGETVSVGALEITAAAARHRGARYAVDQWRGAANMYLLQSSTAACLFPGDTALGLEWHRVLGERGRRVLDVALLPIGHAPWWKRGLFRRGHLTPGDALALFDRLGARYLIPYHWGTFQHLTSGPFRAIEELRSHLADHHRRQDVKILEPGASFALGGHDDGSH